MAELAERWLRIRALVLMFREGGDLFNTFTFDHLSISLYLSRFNTGTGFGLNIENGGQAFFFINHGDGARR
ncbi:MAG: hypothetical protein NMNS01_23240 [Nitrosomonas sp.]|nr:MAG: hypothetical protein NMNS01_23240 [Nitrosomonas sp.]